MSKRLAKKVLLIGWDAADWKVIHPIMDAGLMPTLNSLVNEGVIANLATLDPPLSPMLWTSIATGKTADQHGILQPCYMESSPLKWTGGRLKDAIWRRFPEGSISRRGAKILRLDRPG